MSVNSRLKSIQITGQKKAFYRKNIPGSDYASKETVHIEILITSRNGNRKIMQSIRIKIRSTFRQWAKGSREAASEGPTIQHIRFCRQCSIQTFFGNTVFLKLRIGKFRDTRKPLIIVVECQKYLMFNAFGEGYLSLLKRFLSLSIRRLYFI